MSSLRENAIALLKAARRSIERFPLAVLFAVALTLCCMMLLHWGTDFFGREWRFFAFWYPATGLVLSLSLSLWLEEYKGRWACTLTAVLVHLLWLGAGIFLSRHYSMLGYAPYAYIIAALISTLALSLLVLSFFRDKTDVPFWNFTYRMVSALVVAVVIAGIVCGGLDLLLLSIEHLFGADIDENVYVDVVIICFCLLMPVLFIQGIPGGDSKHDAQPMAMPRLIVHTVTKLFTPIALAYFITLYCYAAKILIIWQLPNGWVSRLVAVSMASFLVLFMLVYPYRDKALQGESGWNRTAVRIITRWMPLLMLPLLLLMSIGIARRIADYGMTVPRAYLMVFNLWCYVVCIILAIRRGTGIMWIPVSLVLTFAGLSLLPVNVSACVRKGLTAKITATLQENGWDGTAMSDVEYSRLLDVLSPETAQRLDDRLDYLKSTFSRQSVKAYIDQQVITGYAGAGEQDEDAKERIQISRYRSILGDLSLELPSNACYMRMYDGHVVLKQDAIKDEVLSVQMPVVSDQTDRNGDRLTLMYAFRIPLRQLRALENEMAPEKIVREEINHAIGYTGTLVDTSAVDAPAEVILFMDTFHLMHDGEEGFFDVTGPLFWE